MPYVRKDRREAAFTLPMTAGELNFCLIQHVLDYIERAGGLEKGGYDLLNEVMGAFDCAARELYRRLGAPYEDGARARNGDVFPDVRPRTVVTHVGGVKKTLTMHWAEAPDLDGRSA